MDSEQIQGDVLKCCFTVASQLHADYCVNDEDLSPHSDVKYVGAD